MKDEQGKFVCDFCDCHQNEASVIIVRTGTERAICMACVKTSCEMLIQKGEINPKDLNPQSNEEEISAKLRTFTDP